jgi:hypothetical protein
MERRTGFVGTPYREGRGARKLKLARALTAGGVAGALLAPRSRAAGVVGGAALVAGSLLTRLGVFEAGVESAEDPQYVVRPQRERLERNGGRPTSLG